MNDIPEGLGTDRWEIHRSIRETQDAEVAGAHVQIMGRRIRVFTHSLAHAEMMDCEGTGVDRFELVLAERDPQLLKMAAVLCAHTVVALEEFLNGTDNGLGEFLAAVRASREKRNDDMLEVMEGIAAQSTEPFKGDSTKLAERVRDLAHRDAWELCEPDVAHTSTVSWIWCVGNNRRQLEILLHDKGVAIQGNESARVAFKYCARKEYTDTQLLELLRWLRGGDLPGDFSVEAAES